MTQEQAVMEQAAKEELQLLLGNLTNRTIQLAAELAVARLRLAEAEKKLASLATKDTANVVPIQGT